MDSPRRNRLLAALPEKDYAGLMPSLEPVEMPLGLSVYESGGVQGYVYFPTSCIVSLLYVLENGSSAEIAIVGNEGLIGTSLFLGVEKTPGLAVVQSGGTGVRIRAAQLQQGESTTKLRHLALRYSQALFTQMAQTAVCNRHHHIQQQLCRWLLLSLDRLKGTEINMTQELIANMLGVRREGVTAAARKLQALGAIRYHRGNITVTDRSVLEASACECYGVVKAEYDRLLGKYIHKDSQPEVTPE
jgi:CRP-like cAMP-binding protein